MTLENYAAIDLTDSPENLAKTIVDAVLTPLLTAKVSHCGEIEATKLYHSIHIELSKTRIEMIGQDAIHELVGIVSELEEEHFPDAPSIIHGAHNTTTFLEFNHTPS